MLNASNIVCLLVHSTVLDVVMGYIIVLKLQRLPVIQELKDMPISQKIQNLLLIRSKNHLDCRQEMNP